MAIFLKKNDTSIWNVYLSDSRKKRTIQNNPARFLLFLLDATSMSGSPPSFSDYLYFYSFMNRKIHAHFHWQPISIVRYCSFSFSGKIMQKQVLYFSWFSESVCLIISARIVFRFVRRPAATSPIRSEDTFFFPGLQIRSAVRSPASCEIGNGTYSWKFAPAISPVSLQAPKDGIRLPQSVTYLPYPSPYRMAFLLSREGLCPRNSIFSLKK